MDRQKSDRSFLMLFEIFVLAIVSEVYFRGFDNAKKLEEGRRRLFEKIRVLKEFEKEPPLRHPFIFFDFGTRRRACREWQEEVVTTLAREVPEFFKGTSNVDVARRYGLVPIGTMAHEYLQAHHAFGYRLKDFQKMAFRNRCGTRVNEYLSDSELYHRQVVLGLRDYVEKVGFEGVVVGSSGGLDSALTIALACDALGARNVKAITMPSQYSSGASRIPKPCAVTSGSSSIHTKSKWCTMSSATTSSIRLAKSRRF